MLFVEILILSKRGEKTVLRNQVKVKRCIAKCRQKALKKINKKLLELDSLLQAAFEKSVLGGGSGSSPDMFTALAQKYEAKKQELTKQANDLTTSISRQSQTENDVDTFIALMKKYINIEEIDRATAVELIDRITISASSVSPREVVIYYNLMGNV